MGGDGTPMTDRPARYTNTSSYWPCIFKGEMAVQRLDPAVKKLWDSRRQDRPKWGDLRNTFRREHCYRINPWGSETCPFAEAACGLAFYNAVDQSLYARNPYGYFRSVCRSTGAARADLGQELRARMRTDEGRAGRGGLRAGPPDGLRDERQPPLVRGVEGSQPVGGVRGATAQPTALGDVLRTLDLGPRAPSRPDSNEEEGG